MASTATILGVVILSLGAIAFAVLGAGKKRRNQTSCASTATILGVVILSQAMASGWSTASLIFCRVIAFAAAAAGRRDSESSSTLSSSGINHEVFLSFRGADTRKGFTDHLYSRLVDAGIEVFRDDEKLHGGKEIKPQLREAIKASKISIAVLSKDYASSRSCLMEVVQMWKCQIFNKQTIIPIFYDVSPNDVKRQAGDFGRSFRKHKKDKVNTDIIIQEWKEVLRNIGRLRGFNLEEIKYESQLAQKVLERVCQVLKKNDQILPDELVGIDLHVQEVMRKLGVVYSDGQAIRVCGGDVRVVGICGIVGVGKTTLARVVYNKMHVLFKECSFLEEMKPGDVMSSQERLIASLQKRKREALNSSSEGKNKIESLFTKRKVFIVLDDVHEVDQIKNLVGNLTWFGSGSRIIVTTDRRNVLTGFHHGAVEEYEVAQMRDHHALQLFRKHAFRGGVPQDVYKYDSLSIDIVKAIGPHPKAIILQALMLSTKKDDIDKWKYALEFVNKHLPEGVKCLFDVGYESLDPDRKKIFLDIACFFVGRDERIPTYMWKACDCYPFSGVDPLRNLHWLENGENDPLRMDNLIRNFGRDIVKRKDGQRCRFWNHSDALEILENPTGTESVEGIGLTVEDSRSDGFTCEGFHEMSKLRYLRLDRANIQGETGNLPSNLRWLDWRDCHFIPELRDTTLKKLVILDLSRSLVARDQKFWSPNMEVKELKVLNLQGCGLTGASMKFQAPNLEILILEDCSLLSEIGSFISKLNNLRSLNLRKCSLVKKLPRQQGWMKSLRELLIDGTGIKEIEIESDSLQELRKLSACDCIELGYISPIGHLTKLTSLALDGAKINWHPETFEFPQDLRRLSLRNCSMLKELPSSIGKLGLLEVVDLSNTKITELPESVKDLSNLKTLKMERTHLPKFPGDTVKLEKLEEIDFSGCRILGGQLPFDISVLSSLRILKLASSNVAGLPECICCHSRLQTLDILKCNRLQALPKLPSSLLSLRWGSNGMTVPHLSYLTDLKDLLLEDIKHKQPIPQPIGGLLNLKTPKTLDIGWITRLPSLETLQLSLSKVTNLPRNFSALTQLRELSLSYMKKLDLTLLPSSSLWTLRLEHCKIQEPNFSGLNYLSELDLKDCDLAGIDGLEDLKLLEVLKITRCNGITNLNGLKDLTRLRKVGGIFSALPSLPELAERVEKDICLGA